MSPTADKSAGDALADILEDLADGKIDHPETIATLVTEAAVPPLVEKLEELAATPKGQERIRLLALALRFFKL